MKTQVKCPYCDTQQRVEVPLSIFESSQVVRCDTEANGCEAQFVLYSAIETVTWTAKIEREPRRAEVRS